MHWSINIYIQPVWEIWRILIKTTARSFFEEDKYIFLN